MELCSMWKVTVCRWKDLSWRFAVRSSVNMEMMFAGSGAVKRPGREMARVGGGR